MILNQVPAMPLLLILAAMLLPRCVIAYVWLTSSWFDGVFTTTLWPVLGFLFMPLTLLWYAVVIQVYGGAWDTLQIVLLVLAVVIDLSPSARKKRKKRD